VPELPDIAAYMTALQERVAGQPLERISIVNPFVLRTQEPPPAVLQSRTVGELRRIGKRIAIGFNGNYWLVLHLMIAGRLRWKCGGAPTTNRATLAVLDFPNGSLVLTEAGSKPRLNTRRTGRGSAIRPRPRRHRRPSLRFRSVS
jgi:formamidopyrimidine-DNA glycosylase